MSLLSYGSFFCFLVGLAVALVSFLQDRRSTLNKSMAFLGLAYSVYALAYIWIFGASDRTSIWFFLQLSTFALLVLVLPSCFWADLIFAQVGLRLRLLLTVPLAFLYGMLFFYGLSHPLIYVDFVPTAWGNYGIVSPDRAWLGVTALYASQSVLAWWFLLRERRKTESRRIRKLIGVLVAGSIVLALVSTAQDVVSRALQWPGLEVFQGLLTTGLLFFLMARYRYLRSDTVTLEREILQAMKEAVVQFEPNLAIRKINPITKVIFRSTDSDLLSREFTSLFDQPETILQEWQRAVRAKKTTELVGVSVRNSDVELVLAPSFDQFGDLVGGVALIRKNDLFESTFAQYGITAREREVLIMLMRGYNRKEIAESQFIAPSTVKNHIHNIYEKTGASNRVELLLMLGGS